MCKKLLLLLLLLPFQLLSAQTKLLTDFPEDTLPKRSVSVWHTAL